MRILFAPDFGGEKFTDPPRKAWPEK